MKEQVDITSRLRVYANPNEYAAPSLVPALLCEAANEIEALRKDAERYRWLRDEAFQATAARIVQMLPGHMDAEIDSAMNGANP